LREIEREREEIMEVDKSHDVQGKLASSLRKADDVSDHQLKVGKN
jgi:hypothetical protein